MLKTLIEQSTRRDGKLKPSAELVTFLSANYPDFAGLSAPEQTYLAIHGSAVRVCEYGNVKFFLSYNKGYRPTCGTKGCPCMKTEKRSVGRSELNKKSAAKFRERTGLASPSQLPGVGARVSAGGLKVGKERSKKIQATMLERYGVSSFLSAPGVHERGIIAAQSIDARASRKTTNVHRYGFENPAMNPDISKRSRLGQLSGTPDRRELFWRNLNTPAWWAEQTRSSADEFMSEFVRSDSTRTRYYRAYRPDFIDEQISVSKPHRVLLDFLDSLGVAYSHNDRSIIKPLELDIVIPGSNIAIEVNGMYWHSESRGKDSGYHLNKTRLCSEAGYHLLHFWDFEIREKLDICKSIIMQRVGLGRKIHARKCEVRPVSPAESRVFLDANHIQGHAPAKFSYGLYHDGVIVSIMTFGKPRFTREYEWEIIRSCNAVGVQVVGGASKLFKRRPPGSIISYADRRLFNGGVYEKLGFSFDGTTAPSYRYTRDYMTTESRHKYQKHKLSELLEGYDADMTERENMANAGFDRVWDCGNTRWVID